MRSGLSTRFAPSPTGRLHLGHAASAWVAWRASRAAGGRFLLRHEDIDPGRARPEHMTAAEEDLRWLGLGWDGAPWRQSERLPAYAAALDRLRAERLIYPCFCTRAEIAAEIARSAAAPHADDAAPPYPGICRHLRPAERAARLAVRPAAWRLDMAAAVARAGPLTWTDLVAGEQRAHSAAQGDVVLARKDAPASYHLAVTMDDAAQGVTLVTRGADLFEATHVHRLLQALLELPTPDYLHHPLMIGADGRRLAKRDGAPALSDLRERGADPRDIVRAVEAWALRVRLPIFAE